MNDKELIKYFVKGLETFPVPYKEISYFDWIITTWNKENIYVKIIGRNGDCFSEDDTDKIKKTYNCIDLMYCKSFEDVKAILGPIHTEIDIKSGAAEKRRQSKIAQEEKEKREHKEALERKIQKQKDHELRMQKQKEKAELYNLKHQGNAEE